MLKFPTRARREEATWHEKADLIHNWEVPPYLGIVIWVVRVHVYIFLMIQKEVSRLARIAEGGLGWSGKKGVVFFFGWKVLQYESSYESSRYWWYCFVMLGISFDDIQRSLTLEPLASFPVTWKQIMSDDVPKLPCGFALNLSSTSISRHLHHSHSPGITSYQGVLQASSIMPQNSQVREQDASRIYPPRSLQNRPLRVAQIRTREFATNSN